MQTEDIRHLTKGQHIVVTGPQGTVMAGEFDRCSVGRRGVGVLIEVSNRDTSRSTWPHWSMPVAWATSAEVIELTTPATPGL
jgi:hypothetical protein